jgi:hypothetical protein
MKKITGTRVKIAGFPRESSGGGGGTTLHPKIFNIFFCDISPITKKSSRLVSHFSKYSRYYVIIVI